MFHYCSTATFQSIIKNKNIWLSALTMSNDTLEGRWLLRVLYDLVDAVPDASRTDALARIERFQDEVDCFGFCVSEEEDLLSQWRGYANDGRGFSIGFSDELLKNFEFTSGKQVVRPELRKVLYDHAEQTDAVREIFELVTGRVRQQVELKSRLAGLKGNEFKKFNALHRRGSVELGAAVALFGDLLYTMKNGAFREEKEWRLIMPILKRYNDASFRVRGDTLVPYVQLSFSAKILHPIETIIIGPKNETRLEVVQAFLRSSGYDLNRIRIVTSAASYR